MSVLKGTCLYKFWNIKTSQSTIQSNLGINNENIEIFTNRDFEFLNILKQMPTASQSVIAIELGWDINTVKYYTKKLKKAGLLDRTGSSRNGKWIVL